MELLNVAGLTKYFGGLIANNNISLKIQEGEVVGLIGPNGSGKSTLFNVITGFLRPETGSVKLDGKELVGLNPHVINMLGIARTFQKLKPFVSMTVLENVITALLPRSQSMKEARQEAYRYIEFVGLSHKTEALAGTLSTGQRKRLEIARAMATRPHLILMDEPAGGVDPSGVKELVSLIKRLREEGKTLFIIEHKMRMIMDISDRIIALDQGSKIADGVPEAVAQNPAVETAYLGKKHA